MIVTFEVPGSRARRFPEFVYRVPIMRPLDPPEREYSANLLPPTYEERAEATVALLNGNITVSLHPTPYTLAREPSVIMRCKWLLALSPSMREAEEFLRMALDYPLHPKRTEK